MKKLFTLILMFSILKSNAQITYSGATGFGGNSNYDNYTRMVKDNLGNMYVAGTFQGTKSFGSYSLSGAGFYNVYIAKFDPAGICQWATACTGANFSSVYAGAIAIDNNYNVYVAGNFTNTATITPYTVSSTSIGLNDMFIARLDNSGNPVWLSKAGGAYIDDVTSLCTKSTGELLMTGSFTGTATFDALTISSGSNTTSDVFIAQYDVNVGTCSWVNKAGGINDDKGLCIITDNAGKIIVSGVYRNTATFGSVMATATGSSSDAFIAKYDASGTIVWVAHGGGLGGDNPNAIGVDALNNVYVAGDFADTAYFGSTMLPDNGYGSIWVAKVDGAAGTFSWAVKAGGSSNDGGWGISVSAGGSSFVTGLFNGTANFSGTNITSAGASDVFVAKYYSNGNRLWVTKLGGTNYDIGKSVIATASNQCLIAGTYYGPVTIGTSTLTSSPGDFNDFITTLSAGTLGIFDFESPESFAVSPNPSNGNFKIIVPQNFNGNANIKITDALGKVIFIQPLNFSFAEKEINVDASAFASGFYSVKLTSETKTICSKVLIQK